MPKLDFLKIFFKKTQNLKISKQLIKILERFNKLKKLKDIIYHIKNNKYLSIYPFIIYSYLYRR